MKTWNEAKVNFIGTDVDFSNVRTNREVMCRDKEEWKEDGDYDQYMGYLKYTTGKIGWCWNDIEDIEYISFLCGPEEKGENISDFFDVYPLMEKIFPEGLVEVGAWENGHIIYFDKAHSLFPDLPKGDHLRLVYELTDYVDRRLTAANAKRWEDE